MSVDAYTRFKVTYQNVALEQPLTLGEGDSLDNDLVLSDDTNYLVLPVTSEQYTKLLSSALNGANRFFPEEFIEVIYPLIKAGKIMFCEQVIECITNDAETQSAIIDFLADSGIQPNAGNNPPKPISTSQSSENLLPSGYTCDNDHLFGMARFVVQQLNESSLQLLQLIEVATNPAEIIALWADNVEGASWFAGGIETVTWIQDQLVEYYLASYSETVEDELSCEIFCIIKDDCEMSLDDILEAYSHNSLGVPSAPDSWLDILDWLINTEFNVSITTVATYHYFLAQALRYSSKIPFFDSFRGLAQIVSLGKNETDSNWNTLCEDCPEETYEIPGTANPFTGVGTVIVEVPAGTTVTITYLEGLWDWQAVTPRFTGNGDSGMNTTSGAIVIGIPIMKLCYSPRPVNTSWFAGGNSFTYTAPSDTDIDLFLAPADNNSSSYANNTGSITVMVERS